MEKSKNPWEDLRKPFPKEAVGLLPRVTQKDGAKSKCKDCGGYLAPHIHLDFVGHANVTDRLNSVIGPDGWNWEPMAFTEAGEPLISVQGSKARMWAWFTVNGVRKPAVGTCDTSKLELEKELIGDLIRNGAMRFGVALDLWSKDELESTISAPELKNDKPSQSPYSAAKRQELVDAFQAAQITGQAAAQFAQSTIGKPAPTTDAEADKLLGAVKALTADTDDPWAQQ